MNFRRFIAIVMNLTLGYFVVRQHCLQHRLRAADVVNLAAETTEVHFGILTNNALAFAVVIRRISG